jgi:hypothetical protein
MRRGLGRGRAIVAVGAVLTMVGVFLPWVTAGESLGDVQTSNGFAGPGALVFLAAIGLLMLIVLPYAASSGRSSLDRPLLYALLGAVCIGGLVVAIVGLFTSQALELWPIDRAPGLWLTIVGVALIALGVGELLGEKPQKPPVRPLR